MSRAQLIDRLIRCTVWAALLLGAGIDLASIDSSARAEDPVSPPSNQVVVDFETAEPPGRVREWIEKGVVFKLAHEPTKSKAKGLVMFFPHIGTDRKGILCAMADDPIPVEARLPSPASSVTLRLWGSTGCPAVLEAFNAAGESVDRVELESVPGRKAPEELIPFFEMTVKGQAIAFIRFSGPRVGEYLAADELRFTPVQVAAAPPTTGD
jgi:hypothetical protein